MIIIEASYDLTERVRKLTPEEYKTFLSLWPLINKSINQETFVYYHAPKTRATLEEAFELEKLLGNSAFTIEGVAGTMLTRMVGSGVHRGYEQPSDLMEAQVVQISLPDIGLLLIDEVTWLEDECTNELQSMLDDGWRILAVCPPNAQRRPDYILGRKKKKT